VSSLACPSADGNGAGGKQQGLALSRTPFRGFGLARLPQAPVVGGPQADKV
jgi:hypothetical protein